MNTPVNTPSGELSLNALAALLPRIPSMEHVGRVGISTFMREAGCSERQIEDYIADLKQAQDSERGQGESRKPTQSDILVNLAHDTELFHAPSGKAFATVRVNDAIETFPVRSVDFKGHLYHLYYRKIGKSVSTQAVNDAVSTLEARARFDGEQHPVFCRVAERAGGIYLDLANSAREVVRITPQGWSIQTDVPVRFRRPNAMLSLPTPVRGANLTAELKPFLNAHTNDFTLMVAWLLSTFQPFGAYPIIQIKGEQGSAKSTTSKLLRNIVDPNEAPARSHPRDERDLVIALSNSHIGCFDNLSFIPEWLSDALCRVSTGQSFSTRTLTTDEDETIFSVRRPIIINGIEELSTRGDLVDRSILIDLPRIPADKRRTEQEFWAAFADAHPRILGALLDTVAFALAHLGNVNLSEMPRMSDFAQFVTAAEVHLGWQTGMFMDAYRRNKQDAELGVLEASPVAQAIIRLVDCVRTWKGTSTELLGVIEREPYSTYTERKHPGWPRGPHKLGNDISRLAPNLRSIGIDARKHKSGERYVVLSRDSRPDGRA